jgi:hypothetical protein
MRNTHVLGFRSDIAPITNAIASWPGNCARMRLYSLPRGFLPRVRSRRLSPLSTRVRSLRPDRCLSGARTKDHLEPSLGATADYALTSAPPTERIARQQVARFRSVRNCEGSLPRGDLRASHGCGARVRAHENRMPIRTQQRVADGRALAGPSRAECG